MQRSDFRFFERLRVRWSEIDAQKIVFNGHYLTYLDTAMAGYWRALAVPYAEAMLSFSGDLFVRKAELEYLAPARYDDVLDVGLRCDRIGRSSIAFVAGVFRHERLLVAAALTYVFADADAMASQPVPSALRDLFNRFESGQPMIEVRVGHWSELGDAARAIRTAVFVGEQNIPAEMEWDDADINAIHAVAFNRFGRALATGRVLEHVPGIAKIDCMAVVSESRQSGVGRAVLDALLGAARERGDREAMLHAQTSTVRFFERAAFARRGPVVDKAGIEQVEMMREV